MDYVSSLPCRPRETARKSTGPNAANQRRRDLLEQALLQAAQTATTRQPSPPPPIQPELPEDEDHMAAGDFFNDPDAWGQILRQRGDSANRQYLVQPTSDKPRYKSFWISRETIKERRMDLLSNFRRARKEARKKRNEPDSLDTAGPSTSTQPAATPKLANTSMEPIITSSPKRLKSMHADVNHCKEFGCQVDLLTEPPKKPSREMETQTDLTYFIWDTVL